MKSLLKAALLLAAVAVSTEAAAQKIYLNPSDQKANPVTGGGNEAQYALINANLTKKKLDALGGFITRVDQDFINAPYNANSWGAKIFISIHSNAGGGHGIETLYKSSGGKVLAGKVQDGLVAKLPFAPRPTPLVYRDNLHVLNNTSMYACLAEVVYHDCGKTSGYTGHPPSESAFLRSSSGQDLIASGLCVGAAGYFGRSCTVTPPPSTSEGSIKGVVYKNGDLTQHIANATVKLNTGQTLTYDGGTGWSFTVAPGTYTVTASASGFITASKTVTVTSGGTSWSSIELKPVVVVTKGTIIGHVCKDVTSTCATKIANATVQLNTGAKVTYDGATAWRFDVAPGTYTLMVSASGYQTKTVTGVEVTANAQNWESVQLAPNTQTGTGGISGNVTRSDTGARIAASIEVNPGGKTASCTASTNWSVTGLTAGTYTVTASAPGFQDKTETVTVAAGATATRNIALAPVPVEKGWLRGIVFRNPNEADEISGATVRLNTGQQATFTSGTEWAFEVPVGTYQVTATATGYDQVTVSATVVGGEETFVALGLDSTEPSGPTGLLKGFVYADPDKARRLAATVALDTGDILHYDGQNEWSLEVPPGTYTVTAMADRYQASSVEKTVAAGETVVVEIGLQPEDEVAEIPDGGCGCGSANAGLPLGALGLLMGSMLVLRSRRRSA